MNRQEQKETHNDTSSFKVFVGGLSLKVTEPELREYLEQFGQVKTCEIALYKTNSSKGYAFACFVTEAGRGKAIGKQHYLKGKQFEVRMLLDSSQNTELLKEISKRKLFISNLRDFIKEKDLQDLFSSFGEIEEVLISRDPVTQLSKGFGFVVFKTIEGARQVLDRMAKKTIKINNSDVFIKEAIPKKDLAKQKKKTKIGSQNKAPTAAMKNCSNSYYGEQDQKGLEQKNVQYSNLSSARYQELAFPQESEGEGWGANTQEFDWEEGDDYSNYCNGHYEYEHMDQQIHPEYLEPHPDYYQEQENDRIGYSGPEIQKSHGFSHFNGIEEHPRRTGFCGHAEYHYAGRDQDEQFFPEVSVHSPYARINDMYGCYKGLMKALVQERSAIGLEYSPGHQHTNPVSREDSQCWPAKKMANSQDSDESTMTIPFSPKLGFRKLGVLQSNPQVRQNEPSRQYKQVGLGIVQSPFLQGRPNEPRVPQSTSSNEQPSYQPCEALNRYLAQKKSRIEQTQSTSSTSKSSFSLFSPGLKHTNSTQGQGTSIAVKYEDYGSKRPQFG